MVSAVTIYTSKTFSGYLLGLEHDNENSILGTESVSMLLLHFTSRYSAYTVFCCQFSVVMISHSRFVFKIVC